MNEKTHLQNSIKINNKVIILTETERNYIINALLTYSNHWNKASKKRGNKQISKYLTNEEHKRASKEISQEAEDLYYKLAIVKRNTE